jgi:type VI protein secretion system component VasF
MKVELIYLLTAFAFWWRLDRLAKQLEAVSYLVRQEMAELVGNEERARELRDEWKQDQDEQKKAIRRMWIFMAGVIGASALAWWWFTVSQH